MKICRPGRRLGIAIVAPALLLALASPMGADVLPTIRVATVPIDAGSEVYYAQKLGIFQKNGINVEITSLNSGSAVTAAVIGGAADIGQSNVVPLAQAHERGIPVTIVAAANEYLAGSKQAGLIVVKDSKMQSARDFNGKTISISGVRGFMELGTLAWLDKNGADPKSVHFLDLPFAEMPDAVANHRIDAAVVTEPVYSAALKSDRFRVVADVYTAIGNEFLIGGWFAKSTWAKDNPQLVSAFAKSMNEAAKWANTHHQQSGQMLAEATNVRMGESDHRVPFAEKLDPAGLQTLIDACAKYGLIKASFPAAQLIGP